ncbi:MAG: YHS domain-containing protein [Spirulina sp. SIO3F2]|nr:YHS domain-containing protein [Spirulina sp. SIO3F2]
MKISAACFATMTTGLLLITSCTGRAPTPTEETTTVSDADETTATEVSYKVNLDEEGRALHGYDPVSYFATGEPKAGSEEHQYEWDNAIWYFETAENRDEFAANPEKYAPENGGFCTFGVVLSKKFDGDPNVWTIYKDRLYVFLNEEVKGKFLQDQTGNLTKVKEIWPQIADKSPEEL